MPEEFGPLYQAAGQQWNISPLLLQSMAEAESTQDPTATGPITKSGMRAKGIMQFMPPTAQQYGVIPDDAPSSIYGAANYMRDLLDKHQGDARAALAEYNHSHPTSPFVNKVMGRFSQLTRDWGLQPSQKNFGTPPAYVPDKFDDENKFPISAGAQPPAAQQPAIPEEPEPDGPDERWRNKREIARGVPPGQGAAPMTLVPHGPAAAPAAPAAPAEPPAAPAEEPMTLVPYREEGASSAPGAPRPGQQYVSSATSPGARAAGQPIAEDRVPGPLFQAAINIPTDATQRARIAADQLGIPLDRIVIGDGNRMAAVGPDGKPYYIEPRKVSSYYAPETRYGPPGTPYEPSWDNNPYQRPFMPLVPQSGQERGWFGPLSTAAGAENLLRVAGGMVPGTVQNALIAGPSALAYAYGPGSGSVISGALTGATDVGRQALANYMDPAPGGLPVFTGDTAKDMAMNWALARGGSLLNPFAVTGGPSARGVFAPGAEDRIGAGNINPFGRSKSLPTEEGPAGRVAPWEPAPPRQAGATETIHLNPLGEAAEEAGAFAPTSAAEAKAHEVALSTVPPQRMPLFTQDQVEARADQIYNHLASGGNTKIDTRDMVPGSPQTMGGLTGNPGLNALERWLRNEPETKNAFDRLIDAPQRDARIAHTQRLVGDADQLEALKAARETQTQQLRDAAFANTTPTDASAAVAEIDKHLAGPEGRREGVAGPLRKLRDSFFQRDAEGNPVLDTDPAMLYGVRKNITDALSPLARGTERDASTASHLLQGVITKLDQAIEAGAPGFRAYMDRFSELSKPVDAMEYLLKRNMTDATTGTPTLAKVDATIKDIERRRLLPGANDAKSISDEQFADLNKLRDDLRATANLSKGKSLGSNTTENFAGGAYLNKLTGPAAHAVGRGVGGMLGSWPGYFAAQGTEAVLGGVNARAQAALKEALLKRVFNERGAGVRALRGGAAEAEPPMSYSVPPEPPMPMPEPAPFVPRPPRSSTPPTPTAPPAATPPDWAGMPRPDDLSIPPRPRRRPPGSTQ